MYTGSEITSGFPRKAIDDIVGNCTRIKEPGDRMRFSCILSSDLCTTLWEIVTEAVYSDSFVNINIPGVLLPDSEVSAELHSDSPCETSESGCSEDSCDSDDLAILQNKYKSKLPSSSSDDST
eukprot:gene4084-20264_t